MCNVTTPLITSKDKTDTYPAHMVQEIHIHGIDGIGEQSNHKPINHQLVKWGI